MLDHQDIHSEMEKVQSNLPSIFWQSRSDDPMLIADWKELALAPTAWAWMDAETLPKSSPVWKTLWAEAITWEMPESNTVEQAIRAWSDYPVWNPKICTSLVQLMEHLQTRDWSSLLTQDELKYNRFGYHLLQALCFNSTNFPLVNFSKVFNILNDSNVLSPQLRERLMVCLLKLNDAQWMQMMQNISDNAASPNTMSVGLWEKILNSYSWKKDWFEDWKSLCEAMGQDYLSRHLLCSQWSEQLDKNSNLELAKSYKDYDFSYLLSSSF